MTVSFYKWALDYTLKNLRDPNEEYDMSQIGKTIKTVTIKPETEPVPPKAVPVPTPVEQPVETPA